ncbi:MAG: hypothetical protein Q9166_002429 [cf. Caloplaca sp. 2 TL-2023]
MDFVSVERVVELLHLEQEPPGSIDPPAWWPSYKGDIVFENVTIRYAPHLDPSLTGLSCRIPAGSTAALLGRTGSGKSTLALSLLAISMKAIVQAPSCRLTLPVKPKSGRILIDNIDISKVNTQDLRNRVHHADSSSPFPLQTFLAQEPVLFPGSMRQNLDPLDEHADDACDAVLQRIGSSHNWTLSTEIEAGGNNLSQGQRQLATASIDTETASQIQAILREELKESTVITIAHRLEAVKDADFFIRLEEGKLVAWGPAGGE